MKKTYWSRGICLALSFIFLLSLSLFTGCSKGGSSKSSSSSVRIAIQPYPLYAPIYVAKNLGFLDDELNKISVKVQWSTFKSGPLVNESFGGNQQDIGVLGDVPAIIGKTSGMNTEIIANAAYGEKALAVLVKKDSAIKSPSDLKGKKIAYVKGSYAHHLISVVLENQGLTFNDIESVNLAAGDIPSALENNQIDAGVLWEPFVTQLVNQGRAKVLIDGTNLKRGILVTIANKDFSEKNPEIISAYLKAYKKASDFILSSPEKAAEAIKNDMSLTKDELINVFKNFNYSPSINGDDIKELKVVEKFLRDNKLSSVEVNIDSLVNTKYLKDALLQ